MNNRLARYRKNSQSHQQLVDRGFSLKHPTKKQPKGCITSVEFGNNGRRYYQVMKMSRSEKKIFSDSDKLRKAGKDVTFSWEPMSIMTDFMDKYHLEAKKDKQGNIHIDITRHKKK